MARKKQPETDAAESPPETPSEPAGDASLPESPNGEKRRPTYKVGPIATDKNNSVCACVWENEITTHDGRTFKVHNVTVEASWRDSDGSWKQTKSFRGSMIYALIYALQRCSDFILSQRDPCNTIPF